MKLIQDVPRTHAGEVEETPFFGDTTWDFYLVIFQIIALFTVLWIIYWIVREVMRYYNITNLIHNENITLYDFLFHDRTDLRIQFQNSQGLGTSVYIGSVIAYPENIWVEGHFPRENVT